MSLQAAVVDPLREPAPAGWDAFAAEQRLLPVWHSRLLRAADWCAQTASSMVLVREAGSDQPVAAFHARHLGPGRPSRFVTPGRIPPVTMTECRTAPALGSGVAFAAGTDDRDRLEAVRVFERALSRRVGVGGRLIAYRGLPAGHLPAIPTGGRLRMRLSPLLVLRNEWTDLAGYLASLPAKWRSQLKKIRSTVDTDATVRVDLATTIDPDEACWLSDLVRRRHLSTTIPRPPWPARYFHELRQLSGSRFLTYRDQSGRLIAYCAMYDTGEDLVPGCWGVRAETDGGRRNLYFDQYLRLIELMIETGRRQVNLGPGMEEIKARYGARPQPRWGVVGLR